jgi:hypothetical protein
MGDSNDPHSMISAQAQKQWAFKLRSRLCKGKSHMMNVWKSESFYRNLLPLRSQDAPDTQQSRRMLSLLVRLGARSEYSAVRKAAQEALLVATMTFYGPTRYGTVFVLFCLFLITTKSDYPGNG